jgi:hypothetical protein
LRNRRSARECGIGNDRLTGDVARKPLAAAVPTSVGRHDSAPCGEPRCRLLPLARMPDKSVQQQHSSPIAAKVMTGQPHTLW